ncbi:MAG TPA: MFS transporter [Steroidobacteraceae bacterium]|nr:MFS transporter [Steroidobacteraceae bacterium]
MSRLLVLLGMVSLLGIISGMGPILAPQIGSLLLWVANWRCLFWLLTALALGSLAAAAAMLDESRPQDRPPALGPSLWLRVIRDRRFLRYALPANFVSASVFAYISGAPFVFIDQLHLTPQRFAWLFGVNALALAPFGAVAGTASAIYGTLQFSFAGLAGIAVSAFYDGSARSMAGVMSALTLAAVALYRWLPIDPAV